VIWLDACFAAPVMCVWCLFSVEHALSCPRGGFLFVRHNEIRDSIAHLLKEICHDVCTEPGLQPLNGERMFYRSAVEDDGARLDIAACDFWRISHQRAYFDVRVFNPYTSYYRSSSLSSCFRRNEQQKRRAYDQRVHDVEMGCFLPLFFSAAGSCGPAANVVFGRLASCIATHKGKPYSPTLCWLRCHIGFSLIHSAVLCLYYVVAVLPPDICLTPQ